MPEQWGDQSWFKVNREGLRKIMHDPKVDDFVLDMAERACKQANDWADSKPRSGRHKGTAGPHFKVYTEPGINRARYTVRPATPFATWLVMQQPAGFMACLDAARRG